MPVARDGGADRSETAEFEQRPAANVIAHVLEPLAGRVAVLPRFGAFLPFDFRVIIFVNDRVVVQRVQDRGRRGDRRRVGRVNADPRNPTDCPMVLGDDVDRFRFAADRGERGSEIGSVERVAVAVLAEEDVRLRSFGPDIAIGAGPQSKSIVHR